ncbi:MAG: putative L-lysine-epsilon aminotransferase [Chloroflexi bacterium ADurb.Bin325]|nr:MAG: putative L-lysine-epsilon aminotransferase [Chloroflexi bacterium ADurb.Bin325]
MNHKAEPIRIAPHAVHETIGRHMLADGEHLVIDLQGSHGPYLRDAATGREYVDFYAHFASQPISHNHPGLCDSVFLDRISRVALYNPANADVYTTYMAEFVETFARIARPADMPYLFFISGGALAVENALKTAFDWKVRKNLAAGRGERGSQIIHFRQAFHGRSGYTLSLTNTADPRKYQYFPRFDWPRISNPKLRFPVTDEVVAQTAAAERAAVAEIKRALVERADDIAGLIIEPIQGEGGDNHFRPEFFAELRRLADENDFLFMVDEVQTGMGATGKMWAIEHMGVRPDIIAFGKKTQVCGIIAGPRVDEAPDNVFKVSSRINSTWGGNLVDMVRSQRYLEIIAAEDLVENAAAMGRLLLDGLNELAQETDLISNVRGQGMMLAFDLPDARARDIFRDLLLENGLIALKSGERSIRFRPMLDLDRATIAEALAIIERSLFDARENGGRL